MQNTEVRSVFPNQHGPAHAATDDVAVIAAVADRLGGLGGRVFMTPAAGADAVSLRVAAEGVVFSGADATLVDGEPRACHDNVEVLATSDGWSHFYGWALSDDGMWRIHSWAVDGDGAVFESTLPRERYVGVALTPQEATAMWGEAPLWAARPEDRPSEGQLEEVAPALVRVQVRFDNPDLPAGETFWAAPVEDGFRVENVPFFAEGFTLGSVVSASRVEGMLTVDGIVSHAFVGTAQIMFFDGVSVESLSPLFDQVRALDCVVERAVANLWVVAVAPGCDAELAELLDAAPCDWGFVKVSEPG